MAWRTVGQQGETFRAQVETQPGWYWVYRPLNLGPRAYDPEQGVVLPVLVDQGGHLHSPLTDLQDLSPDQLVPLDAPRGLRFTTFFWGPVAPGEPSGRLSKQPGQPLQGQPPAQDGWYWCRTRAPLNHVDAQGIGPIYVVHQADGRAWVYPAAFADGRPCDVFELGFAEPLVSEGGLIDASGEVGRHEAELFGPIQAPPPLPGRFPVAG